MDKAFAPIFALPAAERKAAADALEGELIAIFEESRADIRKDGLAETKRQASESFEGASSQRILDAQVSIQTMFNISKLKGNKTSPLLKAFVAAAKKMTDEEYNSEKCGLTSVLAVIDALAKSEGLLKPNPLRSKPAPRS